MAEWNGIFRLFRFSGILRQPREVHPKFGKEILENVAPQPGISGIFGRMESAPSYWVCGQMYANERSLRFHDHGDLGIVLKLAFHLIVGAKLASIGQCIKFTPRSQAA